jgi:nitrogen fixation protein NifQ
MMNGPDRTPYRQMLQRALLASPAKNGLAGDPNRFLLASMIAGQAAGFGCLPAHLGLCADTFGQLFARYFPNESVAANERRLDEIPEREDLFKLLTDERAGLHDSEIWMASIVAAACAGSDHLWQDLGLANRDELSKLMWINFPSLARANSGDMKWKKFLYRQVCSREGIYVCPAPSCGVCTDFAKCFGPEN